MLELEAIFQIVMIISLGKFIVETQSSGLIQLAIINIDDNPMKLAVTVNVHARS